MMTSPEHPDTPETPPVPTPPVPPVPEPRAEAPASPETALELPNAEKSPVLALLLAFIPFGLGHLYLGLYHRALLFFGAFWFSVFLQSPVLAFFFFFFAVIDAFRQAQLINLYGSEGEEKAPPVGQGGLSLGVFLVVVGSVLLLRNWIDIEMIRDFLQDYSPAILVIIGVYLIIDTIRERSRSAAESSEEAEIGDEF